MTDQQIRQCALAYKALREKISYVTKDTQTIIVDRHSNTAYILDVLGRCVAHGESLIAAEVVEINGKIDLTWIIRHPKLISCKQTTYAIMSRQLMTALLVTNSEYFTLPEHVNGKIHLVRKIVFETIPLPKSLYDDIEFPNRCALCDKICTIRCGACKRVFYCSRVCLRKDIKKHRPDCLQV